MSGAVPWIRSTVNLLKSAYLFKGRAGFCTRRRRTPQAPHLAGPQGCPPAAAPRVAPAARPPPCHPERSDRSPTSGIFPGSRRRRTGPHPGRRSAAPGKSPSPPPCHPPFVIPPCHPHLSFVIPNAVRDLQLRDVALRQAFPAYPAPRRLGLLTSPDPGGTVCRRGSAPRRAAPRDSARQRRASRWGVRPPYLSPRLPLVILNAREGFPRRDVPRDRLSAPSSRGEAGAGAQHRAGARRGRPARAPLRAPWHPARVLSPGAIVIIRRPRSLGPTNVPGMGQEDLRLGMPD